MKKKSFPLSKVYGLLEPGPVVLDALPSLRSQPDSNEHVHCREMLPKGPLGWSLAVRTRVFDDLIMSAVRL